MCLNLLEDLSAALRLAPTNKVAGSQDSELLTIGLVLVMMVGLYGGYNLVVGRPRFRRLTFDKRQVRALAVGLLAMISLSLIYGLLFGQLHVPTAP